VTSTSTTLKLTLRRDILRPDTIHLFRRFPSLSRQRQLQVIIVHEVIVDLAVQLRRFHVDIAVARSDFVFSDIGFSRRSLDLFLLWGS
jgi:hypothetical protein